MKDGILDTQGSFFFRQTYLEYRILTGHCCTFVLLVKVWHISYTVQSIYFCFAKYRLVTSFGQGLIIEHVSLFCINC